MFKQRLLTTLVLVPLVLLGIFYANVWVLRAAVLALIIVGAWEWSDLIPLKQVQNKLFFIIMVLISTVFSRYWLNAWLLINLFFWIGAFVALVTFPASQPIWGHKVMVYGIGLLLLPVFSTCLEAIYQWDKGAPLIVYLLCLVWATDIGAYLAGKKWGRHKLIPSVSPGKTIEGSLGGLIMSLIIAFLAYYHFKPRSLFLWAVIAIVITLISMLGDLLISMLKRRCHLKDTGRIFPGHGGVLDRIDSLIAATPFFYYGFTFLVILP